MKFEGMSEPKRTLSAALAEIDGIMGQMRQWGNIDSEQNDIENIKRRLMAGDITPKEAVIEARALEAGRNFR